MLSRRLLIRAAFALGLYKLYKRLTFRRWLIVSGLLSYTFALLNGGPRHSLLYRLTGMGFKGFTVQSNCDPKYAKVKAVFERNFKKGLERGSQFVVYHQGKKVVDLWGRQSDVTTGYNDPTVENLNYDGDTMQNVYSCTKSVAAICVAMGVDEGWLSYDDPVSKHWPEFAANGKQHITIKDVMRHESGLSHMADSTKLAPKQLGDLEYIASVIARQKPGWECNTFNPSGKQVRVYHGLSRGMVINEFFRRAHPEGLTIGQFVQHRLSQPHNLRLHVGTLPKEHECFVSPVSWASLGDIVMGMIRKRFFEAHDHEDDQECFNTMLKQLVNPNSFLNKWMGIVKPDKFWPLPPEMDINTRKAHTMELPSFGGLTNARSLAKLAAALSMGGQAELCNGEQVKILSRQAFESFHADPVEKMDHGIFLKTSFTQGGVCLHDSAHWGEKLQGFYGWGGVGGSMFVWNPEKQLGIAYSMTALRRTSFFGQKDPRCVALLEATLECLRESA